jgi:hypothetical protein
MKKILATVAIAASLGAVLIGCGGNRDETQATSATTQTTYQRATTTTSRYSAAVEVYLSKARNLFPSETDAKLISLGEQACDVIIAYGSLTKTLLAIAEDPDWTTDMAYDAGYMFGIAIPVYCPQFTSEARVLASS